MPVDVLASTHLRELCSVNPDRRPGSPGNTAAAGYVAAQMRETGWQVTEQAFEQLDWSGTPGTVEAGRERWMVIPSPYAKGAELGRQLVVARTREELDRAAADGELTGRALLMLDDVAREPLTPTDYPFFGNPDHAELLALLTSSRPAVVLAGTGTAPSVTGSLDPFPLIEDGAFPIPTGNLTLADAEALARHAGETVRVVMTAHRWPSTARNIIARRGPTDPRVVVVAHLDSKPGTPGAIDNASGVVVLLLLARLLPDLGEHVGVELLAVNGEDCYSAGGERAYLHAFGDYLDEVALVANVDGVGYRGGGTAFSRYGLSDEQSAIVDRVLLGSSWPGARLSEGEPWYSSDHMVFAQRGRPALAFTTDQLETVLAEVAHSPNDTPSLVDIALLVGLSEVLAALVREIAEAT